MKKIFSLIMAILMLTSTIFANYATIKTTSDDDFLSFRLTPEIYRNSNADLSDLVLKNKNDELVPFYIDSYKGNWQYASKTYHLLPLDLFFNDNDYYIDLGQDGEYESRVYATSIVFETISEEYLKNITIYGSYDSISWEKVQDDMINTSNGFVKNEIIFQQPLGFDFYRVKFENAQDFVEFKDIYLVYETETAEKMLYLDEISIPFKVENNDDISYVEIQNTYNLIMDKIQIISNDLYEKTVQVGFISSDINSYEIDGYSYFFNTIDMQTMQNTDLDLQMKIHNNDSNNMKIGDIIVTYYADNIVFKNDGNAPYTLEFGGEINSNIISDTLEIEQAIKEEKVSDIEISKISIKNDAVPQKNEDFMIYLVVLALTGAIIVLFLNKRKKYKEK